MRSHQAMPSRCVKFWLPLAVAGILLSWAPAAFALSEIKQQDTPSTGEIDTIGRPPSVIPSPEMNTPGALPDENVQPDGSPAPNSDQPPGDAAEKKPVPEILYDTNLLPEPVRRMRELIIEACKTGDPEALRPLLGRGDDATQLAIGGIDSDPIDYLKQMSGDEGGQEILAILLEIMKAGFVHLDAGTPDDMYVWPYFYSVPLESLTPKQRVELFELITSGDYEDMKAYGAYIFYRSAIAPDGRWIYFVGGD